MLQSDAVKKSNPFRKLTPTSFVCGEPQEEALARIEYLQQHGAGWCLLTGHKGMGKSLLLNELSRRAKQRGEACNTLYWSDCEMDSWWTLLADAWRLPVEPTARPTELRRRLEDYLMGLSAMNRPVWLLVDHMESLPGEFARHCRWLVSAAAQRRLTLTLVLACGVETAPLSTSVDADLRLELWPWSRQDCERYVTQCLKPTGTRLSFSDEAFASLHERTDGIPGQLTKLCEWIWLAAMAESLDQVDADLVHAVADELSPSSPPRSTYDHSAAYGAW